MPKCHCGQDVVPGYDECDDCGGNGLTPLQRRAIEIINQINLPFDDSGRIKATQMLFLVEERISLGEAVFCIRELEGWFPTREECDPNG